MKQRKKFAEMTPQEKKQRIEWLWDKARNHFRAIGLVKKMQQEVENDFLNQFAQDNDYTQANTDYDETESEKIPVYLCFEDSTGVAVFKFVLGVFLILQMVQLAFLVSIDTCFSTEITMF